MMATNKDGGLSAPMAVKRVHLESPAVPSGSSFGDLRGSFQRAASTNWEADIRQSATNVRYHVSRGGPSPAATSSSAGQAARGMKRFQTAPELTFGTQSTNTVFQTTNETLASVYGGSPLNRHNEVQPMWITSSLADPATGMSPASPHFPLSTSNPPSVEGHGLSFQDAHSGLGSPWHNSTASDGFDAEMAFGPANASEVPSNQQSSPRAAYQGTLWNAQPVRSTKRRYSADDLEEEDEEGTTDVEDEGMCDVAPLPVSNTISSTRPLAGRRAFGKTQSLPAHVFSNPNF